MISVLAHVQEAAVGIIFSVGGWILVFPLRTFTKTVKTEWAEKTKMLESVHKELTEQRTNCLTTLQKQGTEQIKVLEKAVDLLDKIHTSQAEMSGYLRGSRE
jgi:hypothetical protein